jgi:hypothetical protein
MRFFRRAGFWAIVACPVAVGYGIWTGTQRFGGPGRYVEDLSPVVAPFLGALSYVLGHWPLAEERRSERLSILLAAPSPWAVPSALLLAAMSATAMSLGGLLGIGALEMAVDGTAGTTAVLSGAASRLPANCLLGASLGLLTAMGRPRWDLAAGGLMLFLAAALTLTGLRSPFPIAAAGTAMAVAWFIAWGARRKRVAA